MCVIWICIQCLRYNHMACVNILSMYKHVYLYIDSIFTCIVTRPCDIIVCIICVSSTSLVLNSNHLCESVVSKPLSFLTHFYLRPVHAILIKGKIKQMFLLCSSTGNVRFPERKSHHKNWTKETNIRHIQFHITQTLDDGHTWVVCVL